MIAGAEAHRIARALDSVKAWAGEIIVVLNEEVQDGTDRIAEACGARVVREPWKGHIEQKNSATAKATQDWVLGLDADEEVSPRAARRNHGPAAPPADGRDARRLLAFRAAPSTVDDGSDTGTGILIARCASGRRGARALGRGESTR
jgi:glycosyltransferase involved in cell wall biosynthesis